MTETTHPTGEGPATPPPPPPPGPWGAPSTPPPPSGGSFADGLRRLRRRPDDKVVAGVAASVARALDIDPVIIRIAFVLLTLFGGSGIVLYLIGWALIPEWPEERSWVVRTLEGRNGAVGVVALVIGAVILVPLLASTAWWGPWNDGPGFLLALALIAVGVVLLTRGDERAAPPAGPAPGAPPPTDPAGPDHPGADTAASARAPTDPGATGAAWAPPSGPAAGGPPPGPPGAPPGWSGPPPVPTPPQRRSPVTPLTLSLLAVLLGGLIAVHALGWVELSAAGVIATLLVGTGLGLAVGALVGGGRGLIAVGVVLGALLVPAWAIDVPVWSGAGERLHSPGTAAELDDEYRLGAGRMVVDLRDLDLDGATRRLDLGVTFGELELWLPDDVDVELTADAGMGEVDVLGRRDEGLRPDVATRLDRPDETGTLIVDIDLGAGRVQVR